MPSGALRSERHMTTVNRACTRGARRYALIQDLLKTIEPRAEEVERPDTLGQALGLLATDQPSPSDEEAARWLHERRTEKYG